MNKISTILKTISGIFFREKMNRINIFFYRGGAEARRINSEDSSPLRLGVSAVIFLKGFLNSVLFSPAAHRTNPIFIFLVIIIFFQIDTSFSQVPADTLQQAKALRDNGKYRKSMELFDAYHKAHPDDMNATWLYAQTAYWSKHYSLSSVLYEEAISKAPKNKELRLDYAKMLTNTGDLGKADQVLQKYTADYPADPEAWFYMAKVRYWQGDEKKALVLLGNLLKNVPDYQPALKLRKEILGNRAPWLRLMAAYSFDDQPMEMLMPVLDGGWHLSSLGNPDFQLTVPVRFDSTNFIAQGFRAGNKFNFTKADLSIYLNAGIFNYSTLNSLDWTGDLLIEKHFFRKLRISAELRRMPYLSTLSSTKTPVLENHLSALVAWDDMDHWNGQVSYEASTFSTDNNNIQSFCGWVFAPAIKPGRFDFHFGYGYNYSTSKESMFVSEKPLDDLISDWTADMTIEGIYNPYFTPNNQRVHSLLGIFNYRPVDPLKIGLNVNVGVYATTMNPYLFLNTDPSGNIFIDRGFEEEKFTPLDLRANFAWQLSRTIDLTGEFRYSKTLFYSAKIFSFSIRKKI